MTTLAPVASNLYWLYISTSTSAGGTPVWEKVEGQQSITPQPSTKTADGTTVDNAGWTQDVPVSGGLSYAFAGLAQRDTTTGALGAGQAAVKVLGSHRSAASIGHYAIQGPDADEALEFHAYTRDVVDLGGSPDALAPFTFTLITTAPPTVSTDTELGLPARS